MLSFKASGNAIITQVEGNVTVKVPSLERHAKLSEGAILANNIKIIINDSNSHYSVLCSGAESSIKVTHQQPSQHVCPVVESRKMRSTPQDYPFIFLPNQSSLGTIDRILWSGPKGDDYNVSLFQIIDTSEQLIKFESKGYLSESGVHELRLLEPLPLKFSKSESINYYLVVENENIRKSSLKLGDELILPIVQAPSASIMAKGFHLLNKQKIKKDSALGKLVLAAFLIGKNQRSEAYTLLSSISDKQYLAQSQLLKANILFRPGAPTDIIVREYARALSLSVDKKDLLSTVVACQGISNSLPLLFSNKDTKIGSKEEDLQEHILSSLEYMQYCSKL